MHREGKIQNVRSTIDKLILSKNNFLSKLLAIIDSNEDAYLINEVILLLLLVAEYNGEVRNIITYERFIETVMRIMQDEHAYLFRPTSDLHFLYEDGNVVVPNKKTKITPHPAANKGNEKREEMNHTQVGAVEVSAVEVSATEVIAPQGDKPHSEQKEMEIYLDNISINIDLKSSLLLLKCLIISSEFGLKYIYELNIFEQFIKLVLNMYNVIIYIYKNDMKKYFSNSIFVLNIFLDVLASSCKVDGVVNSYTGLSCKKFLLILQKERFFESSFFFFFKFMCIYMEKYSNGGRRADQLGHHRNENSSNYDGSSEALMTVGFNRVGNAPLPGGSNSGSISATVSANVSASASSILPNSDSAGGQLGSNPVGASIGSNLAGSSQTGSGQAGGLHAGSNMYSESEQIMRIFKNTHFVGILNMCCKFLLQDESLCVRVLFTPFAVSSGGDETSKSTDKHDEVNSFVEGSLKQKNYFLLEQVLTYYMKHLKQIKYADLLLIMFLYDRKKLFSNTIYEFFLFLGGKHPHVGKYLMDSLLSRRTVFYYCVMHTARRVSKLLLKLKKAFQRRKKTESKSGWKNNDELVISGANRISQKEKFFLKYMNLSELLLKICNLTSSHNPDERLPPADEFLKSAKLSFEQMMYYNTLFTRDYSGMWKHHLQKANEKFSESVLTFRINSILYRKNVKGQMDSLKFLVPMLNAHENIRAICDVRRQKYFFNYSREFSIFCIHFVYSNFIHHSMLSYFFEQSKGSAYRKDPPGGNRNGYSVKRSHSGGDRRKEGGDAECSMLSESDYEDYSQADLDREGSESDDWSEEDRDVDAPNRKGCEDYSLDEDHHSSASSGEETTRQTRTKNKAHLFYSRGGAENERSYLKNKAMKTKGEGGTRGRKNNTQSMAHISEEVSQLRKKLNEQEVTHLEEKIYLNKIIEKKNDIINNMLYSYSMMKEKCVQVESELVKVRTDLGLKEKEYQLVAANDMDDLKAQHIRVLRDYERVGSEKRELETQFEKLTDLLIFLYENVAACRKYMQNVEDVNVFKNPRMGANPGGDPPQPNCEMLEVGADVHMNAEVKGSVDALTQPNDQLNRGGYQLANDQVWGQHSGGAYANVYNPAQQNFPPQGYQNSPYEGSAYGNPQQQGSTYSYANQKMDQGSAYGNPQQQGSTYSYANQKMDQGSVYGNPQQQGSTYSYANQQMDQGGANSHPQQQMHQGSTYAYPPEPMQQVRMYGDPNPPAEGNSSHRVFSEVHPPVTQPPPDRQYEQQYGQLYEQAPPQMYNQLYFQTNPHVYPHMYVESTGQNASGSNALLNVSAGDQGPNCEGSQGQPNEQNCPAEFSGQ
ncbi:hypothetical protein PCYB_011420 [Plasmodium cynomolgi strain B]|uniref:Uncharacterized protein n=1 Tax=Plasmodium cynomolgi (strain B) TaxID=1120755 RepID=K6UPB0_PLACD|nr:hypothetical protein PCYB_011420 [Plasmodium cynomolgi strain B]GAB64409.1 hypothetical protein PCYB_011420 [Plasmodium cynomolgi strain B]